MHWKIAKEPRLAVTVYVERDKILKVDLASSVAFTCSLESPCSSQLKENLVHWLDCYAKKQPIALPNMFYMESLTSFQQQVLKTMETIPFSKTISYQELAHRVGKDRAYQAMGQACSRNPFPLFFPCHRVIATDGSLRGFAYGLPLKKHLLNFEK